MADDTQSTSPPTLIAPLWHTGVLLLVILGIALWYAIFLARYGIHSAHVVKLHDAIAHHRLRHFLLIPLFQFALVAWIRGGIHKRGGTLRSLIGGRWANWRAVLRDLALAVAFFIGVNMLFGILHRVLPPLARVDLRYLTPHGPLEQLGAFIVALSAGFCEEIIFRGYLQRQLTALTRSATAGLILQAIIFGMVHSYQGLHGVIYIGIYGYLIGAFAFWRKSLRPGMIAHALHDSAFFLIRSMR